MELEFINMPFLSIRVIHAFSGTLPSLFFSFTMVVAFIMAGLTVIDFYSSHGK